MAKNKKAKAKTVKPKELPVMSPDKSADPPQPQGRQNKEIKG